MLLPALVGVHSITPIIFPFPLSDSLSLLVSAIQRPDAREDYDSANATENAIAAVAKICKHISNGVPYDSILPLWLSWLPVVEDRVEALHVYSYLCDLIEGYDG